MPPRTCRPGLLVLLLMLACVRPGDAQLLRGTVTDEASGRGVPGASLAAVAPTGVVAATAVTDSAGFFLMRLPAPAEYSLRVVSIGYAEAMVPVPAVGANEELSLRITIAAAAVPLQPLTVLGRRSFNPALMNGYYQRAAARRPRNDGRILVREDLARMNVSQASEYLRQVPTLQLRPVPLGEGRGSYPVLRRMGSLCEPAVYLNGNRIAAQNVDSFIRVGTLEGIEVYTQGDEPPEFWDRAGCGVILIWNRSDTDGERLSWGRTARVAALVAGVATILLLLR
jgi:hypothetical protein